MPSSTGVNAVTGAPLTDWEHTQQSIRKILLTPIGTRVMRRDFGSEIPDLIDAKMNRRNVLALYSAAATAIAKWEPRYRMRFGQVSRAEATGQIELAIHGTYFPLGHRGDYSVSETQSVRVVVAP
ncbi:GPW/gp25 family protein [Agrobacterium rosae]|uniref:Baseplate assembly protein n=1 Tax=Agrobacterium rosae TaxID=1972867 RepID=A0AAE5S271_9HYPH|nr:GPW/gp25 family protein [Agrobacterium rosae]MCM2434131.1 baseplate assembly protein [Agrobacterium rosae]POO54290.1 baseplate assembly protein [Agrobacterium rosae]